MLSLFRSRKFWIAVTGLAGVILVDVLGVAEGQAAEIVSAIEILAVALIGGIALEDAAAKYWGDEGDIVAVDLTAEDEE